MSSATTVLPITVPIISLLYHLKIKHSPLNHVKIPKTSKFIPPPENTSPKEPITMSINL